MSKLEKLIAKILNGSSVSYADAEKILLHLGFDLSISSSHHIFRKNNYVQTISIKKRKDLAPYQIHDLKRVLKDHGYEN